MPVVRLLIAYDGTSFHGWARQPAVRTVQGALEEALSPLTGGARTAVSVAGRTDAGVHAWGQVASFAAPAGLDPAVVQRSLNARLAPEVVIRSARRAPSGFDARFSATAREYRYRIDVGPVPDPFSGRFVWHRPGHLDLSRMRVAARALLGEHDFASFCRTPAPPAGTVRRLDRVSVSASGERVQVGARANAFCHQMVRSLVGTLVAIGAGRIEPDQVAGILEARDRGAAGAVAPPHGLTLWRVVYGRGGRTFDAPREPRVD
jgi:tRNA pseudouridine38-40 synthase